VFTAYNGYGIVGKYVDPIFGETEAGFAFQLSPGYAYPFWTEGTTTVPFGTNAKVDSMVMSFAYDTVYSRANTMGNPDVVQELSLNLLTDTTPNYAYAHTKVNPATIGKVLAKINHKKYQQGKTSFKFRIQDAAFTNGFFQNTDTFKTVVKFHNFIKGLLLTSSGATNTLTKFNLYSDSTYCTVYYKNDQTAGKDTVVSYNFRITSLSRSHTYITHKWNSTTLNGKIDNQSAKNAPRLYVQSMAGTRPLLKFPGIKNWHKGERLVIRAAELIIKRDVGTVNTYVPTLEYMNIYQRTTAGSNGVMNEYYNTSSYDYNQAIAYDKVDGEYRFDVTTYITALRADDTTEDTGLILTAPQRSLLFGEVVLHSAHSESDADKMYLKISYTKF
jgi:hypothetical protein